MFLTQCALTTQATIMVPVARKIQALHGTEIDLAKTPRKPRQSLHCLFATSVREQGVVDAELFGQSVQLDVDFILQQGGAC